MKRTFYKTWGLLHFTEQNELVECEREYYETQYGKDYTEEQLENYVRELHEDRFADDFAEMTDFFDLVLIELVWLGIKSAERTDRLIVSILD